jgi:cysteine synthase A
MARYENILDTIGHTPLVRLNQLVPNGINVYAKVESFNPMGSVKDRMAKAVIERAQAEGELQPGQTVIEATSGNTGIGLAMVCAQKGIPLVVVMAESFSVERRKLMRFLGAKVVLTPASEKGTGMLNKAKELAEAHGWYLCRQFENEANADVHSATTAREIIDDMAGERIDYFVSGFGTGGTLKGVARALKGNDPNTRIIAAEPDNAQVLGSGIPQARHPDGSPDGSHPQFRPHLMQGWAPDFISKLTEDALVAGWVDEIVPVAGNHAMDLCKGLARREGIFVGTTSGGSLAAALTIARTAPPGTNIVCMLHDTGERYLSTPLFADIAEDMDPEEIEISRSTPSFTFDVCAPSDDDRQIEMRSPASTVALDPDAEAFVDELTGSEAVVMFALEWCEFCWSVRRLFAALGVPYRSVDLDSVTYQQDDLGGKLRAVLLARTGEPTIPQIYIGGEHVGGATDLFNEYSEGTMTERLVEHGVELDDQLRVNPADLLPKWVHPRQTAA